MKIIKDNYTEDKMNDFCDYLENLGIIDYTEVWLKEEHTDLYGRTFTNKDKNKHRIEIYKNNEYTNLEILFHELAHVCIYKKNNENLIQYNQKHGKCFKEMKEKIKNYMKDYLKEIEGS